MAHIDKSVPGTVTAEYVPPAMGPRRVLFGFGIGGGLVAGCLIGLVMVGLTGEPSSLTAWSALLTTVVASFMLAGHLTWFTFGERRAREQAQLLARVSSGDLTVTARTTEEPELGRLLLSLRSAVAHLQRMALTLSRASEDVSEQAQLLFSGARRAEAGAERTWASTAVVRESVESAAARLRELEAFAEEARISLAQLADRSEQVLSALHKLEALTKTQSSESTVLHEQIGALATAVDAISRLATDAEHQILSVDGALDAAKRRAAETADLHEQMQRSADTSAEQLQSSLADLQHVEDTVGRSADLVDSLGTRSQQIGRIVDVIRDVADQTNLLALNAAIIAAQAGESGRAFGVVADEIRGLAERTARSTREISSLVAAVQDGVDGAAALVREGHHKVGSVVRLGEAARTSLDTARTKSSRTRATLDAIVAELVRLEGRSAGALDDTRRFLAAAAEVGRSLGTQHAHSHELAKRAQEMMRLLEEGRTRAAGHAETGRDLSDALLRLGAAVDEIRSAHEALSQSDALIRDEVTAVRDDSRRALRLAGGMAQTLGQLRGAALSLESEVSRFRLPQARKGGTLRVAVVHPETASIGPLDPVQLVQSELIEIAANLYNGLVRFEDGLFVPDLAERWETDAEGRTYRFTLRSGVRFHEGTPLTAQHVKAHFERLLNPASRSPHQWLAQDIEGAAEYVSGTAGDVEGLRVIGDRALEIRLVEPRPSFMHALCAPAAFIAKLDERRNPAGTGAFRLTSRANELIVLERNTSYFRSERPYLDRLELHLVSNAEHALAELRQRHVDLVPLLERVPPAPDRLRSAQTVQSALATCTFLGFGAAGPPFSDVRVRQALRAGLDISGMVQRFHPGAVVARAVTPPSVLESESAPAHDVPDVSRAATLLKAAGMEKLTLVLSHPRGHSTEQEDAVLFAPLASAGLVEVRHEELDVDDYWERHRRGEVAVFRGTWAAPYPDPDAFLFGLLGSSGQKAYGLAHHSAELDALTRAARRSADPKRRAQVYRQAERIVSDECPVIPLYHHVMWAAATPLLQDLRPRPTPPQIRLEDLWLDRS